MNNDTVMYIAVAAAVLAVIALIMICQVRSSLNQSAAPAAAAKKAAPAAASRAADNGAVVGSNRCYGRRRNRFYPPGSKTWLDHRRPHCRCFRKPAVLIES